MRVGRFAGAPSEVVDRYIRYFSAPAARAGLFAGAFAAMAVLAVVGVVTDNGPTVAVGFALAVAFAAIFAADLIVTERRRHEAAEQELSSEARFLESLVESMAAIAAADEVLDQTCREAERLFEAQAEMLSAGERPRKAPAENAVIVPLKVRDEEIGALRLTRPTPFTREELVRATVLADFAARAYENARLLEETKVREADRSRLSDQLITAEQEERRRLADELHDGAVQSLSGIALLLDAGLNSIDEGRKEEAQDIIRRALERHRATIGQLRDLSFSLEPVVLRDQGFVTAVRALTEQIGIAHQIRIDVDVEAAERLAEKTQAALYQIIREALNQAIRRGPPNRIWITIAATDDGGVETVIADDAPGERRRRSLEELAERARTLNGTLTVAQGDNGGTRVCVTLPPYIGGD